MTSARGRLSIAIPLYRPNVRLLEELFQGLQDSQLDVDLVLTDDDPDYTAQAGLVARLQATSLPFRYVPNVTRLGMTGNWNQAVRSCQRDHVLLHCQDDRVALPGFTGLVEAAISQGADVAVGRYRTILGNGTATDTVRFGNDCRSAHYESASEATAIALTFGNVYGYPSSTIFARSLFDRIGGFNDRYEHMTDLEFVLRATVASGTLLVDPSVVSYRNLHDANLTHAHVASGATGRDRDRLWQDFGNVFDSRRDRSRAHAMCAVHSGYDALRHLRERRPAEAFVSARQAVRHGLPGSPGLWWSVSQMRRLRTRT